MKETFLGRNKTKIGVAAAGLALAGGLTACGESTPFHELITKDGTGSVIKVDRKEYTLEKRFDNVIFENTADKINNNNRSARKEADSGFQKGQAELTSDGCKVTDIIPVQNGYRGRAWAVIYKVMDSSCLNNSKLS